MSGKSNGIFIIPPIETDNMAEQTEGLDFSNLFYYFSHDDTVYRTGT